MKSFWSYFVMGAFCIFVLGVGINVASGQKNGTQGGSATSVEGGASVDIESLASELQEKELRLANQEKSLKDWEDRLKVQEARIKARIDELRSLTERREKVSEELRERQEHVAQNLVKTFETMNPRKAAEVLSVMEQVLAVELLMAMKAKNVATILDKMDSNKAMMLSSQIAERKPAEAN